MAGYRRSSENGSISDDPLSTDLHLWLGVHDARAVPCQSVLTCATRPRCARRFWDRTNLKEVRPGVRPVREEMQEGPVVREHLRARSRLVQRLLPDRKADVLIAIDLCGLRRPG